MTVDTDFLAKWTLWPQIFFPKGKKSARLRAVEKSVDSDSRVVGALAFLKYKQVL